MAPTFHFCAYADSILANQSWATEEAEETSSLSLRGPGMASPSRNHWVQKPSSRLLLLENSPGRDVSLASCPTAFCPLGTSDTTNNQIQGDPHTKKSPFLAGEPCKRALFTFLIGKQASVLLTTCFYVSSCALADFPDCLSTGTIYCLPQILLPKHLLSGSARLRLLVEVMLSGKEVVSASNSLPR